MVGEEGLGAVLALLLPADIPGKRRLVLEHGAALLDGKAETMLREAALAEVDAENRGALERNAVLLATCREEGITAAFAQMEAERAARLQNVALRMTAAPDWHELRAAIELMPQDLLSEEVDSVLTSMIANLEAYQACLRECRAHGVDAAFRRRVVESLPDGVAGHLESLAV